MSDDQKEAQRRARKEARKRIQQRCEKHCGEEAHATPQWNDFAELHTVEVVLPGWVPATIEMLQTLAKEFQTLNIRVEAEAAYDDHAPDLNIIIEEPKE